MTYVSNITQGEKSEKQKQLDAYLGKYGDCSEAKDGEPKKKKTKRKV